MSSSSRLLTLTDIHFVRNWEDLLTEHPLLGDGGKDAISNFLSQHRCNDICKAVALDQVNPSTPDGKRPGGGRLCSILVDSTATTPDKITDNEEYIKEYWERWQAQEPWWPGDEDDD